MLRWRIAGLLKKRDKTAYWLAQEIGLTVPATYRLVAGQEIRQIKASTLEALCDVFRVEPCELIERVPDKKRHR